MGLFRGKVPEEAAAYAVAALPRLIRTARNLTRNEAAAEDLVQETLIQVMTHWEKVRVAEGPDAYVRRIMVNLFVSGKRRRSATEVVSHDLVTTDRGAAFFDLAEQQASRGELWERLGALTRQQRAVLVLRFYEDLPDATIAELLDLSVGNVRVIAHRALTALRAGVSANRTPMSGEPLTQG